MAETVIMRGLNTLAPCAIEQVAKLSPSMVQKNTKFCFHMLEICNMEWSDLKIFLAIVQHGSLRRAAESLGVTQPTVSRRIRGLEQYVGLPLFERDRGGHRLTPAGEELLPEARAVESAALRVEQSSMRLTSELQETIRIAAGQTSAAVLAQGLHLMKSGPMIEIVVTDSISHIDTRAPDIFIDHDLPSDATGMTRRVGSVSSAVYGAQANSMSRTLPLSSHDLATLPWLGFVKEQEHYITMKWLNETMRGRPPAARMENADLMVDAAANGVGIAVLPCFKGDRDSRLVRLSEHIDILRADYWTVIQSDLAQNPSVRAALNWIIESFGAIELPESR